MPRSLDPEEDDRPRRKKKKKKKRPEKSRQVYWILGGAAGFVFIAVVIGLLVVLWPRSGTPKTTAPKQFVGHNSTEEVFHVSLPADWRVESGGKRNMGWITAEKRGAAIRLNENLTSSLIGDIAGAGQRGEELGDEFLPVSRVHEFRKEGVAEGYSNYKEEPATTVQTQFGKARRSEFTAGSKLTGKVRGYRVTILGPLTSIAVICECTPADWDILEPAFSRAIASIGPGPSRE